MILTTTTQKLQVFLAGAITTANCPINIDYVDFDATTTTPAMTSVNTNGVTTTDILAAPAASTQRKVNGITLFNADTAAVVVTIQINDNATLYQLVSAMTIPVGGTLQYTDRRGWSVVTQGGGIKTTQTNLQQEFTANGTWTKPAAARFVMVEVVGGGGGGGASGNNCCCISAGGGGGGGGGKRNRFLFLAKDLPATVSVTVAAAAPGAAYNGAATAGNTSNFGTYLYGYGGGPGSTGYVGSTYGGGGGGGTSASSGSTGGSAFATAAAGTAYADARGGGGGGGSGSVIASNGVGSFLGGGGGGGSGGDNSSQSGTAVGGYSWFSAGGGGGGFGNNSGSGYSYGGGAGSTPTGPVLGSVTDALGCGTGGSGFCNGGYNVAKNGGFPGGGGGGGNANPGPGGAGAAGVVRVWCW